ncbi:MULTISPECIES: type I polyketide synthase [unclassified Tolypothrix]|uniref:type I polyketide synthase n=1 Tax=unclassified Tolypothrix TaxID=2649714 RepID=UPI0006937C69|nr:MULTISPECIES: type I polyketide synthase [unclassified Tolypothrix]BAY91155.1 beta-ketoacyl synthase [Microchaete diplosiphon NIES-3275]
MNNSNTSDCLDEIAIIGMAGCFPGAKNIDEFWQNLRDGVESISFFTEDELLNSGVEPALLNQPNYVKAGAILDDIELFDASFFNFNPREAEITDPQHRFLLECAWNALENAGYDSETYLGRIGIFAGASMSSYFLANLYSNRQLIESVGGKQIAIANSQDFLPTLISYKLNLQGPSVNVQTSCSTSLVAVHLASQSLLNGESDIALAGGVSIGVPHKTGYPYQQGSILSPDGHCRAFDAKAQGTVSGNGVGMIVLKRLEDAIADRDTIHAVIKASAINNDGSAKVGYTAPSIEGQAKVIAEALAVARISPEKISYIEAHGTGTVLGDPIEIAALTQAFRAKTDKKGYCAVGSVKTNIGHLDTAAGVTGLIKTVLALKHQQIPPTLHYQQPNPKIDFANSPFYVNHQLSQWNSDANPRYAGVSSFGIGGTNAHVILEEAPVIEQENKGKQGRGYQLLVLSAKTASALETATTNLVKHLQQHPNLNLADVAYTLSVGRRAFEHRLVVVCQNLDDAVQVLEAKDPQRVFSHHSELSTQQVAFMFPGQGTQYVNMAKELYQTEPIFREQVDYCCELLKPLLEIDLRSVIYPQPEQQETAALQLQQTYITQPALFVIEYALAQLWMSWGINPSAMIGHSIGEYVAATVAGVFSLEDALLLVATRGKLIQQLPSGTMLAVPMSAQKIQPLLNKQLSLAAINSPNLCVVSGTEAAVAELQNQLSQQSVDCRRLHTSHAFHSQMMDSILEPFQELLCKIQLNSAKIPFISNVTGTWITTAQATDGKYWVKHLRQTVHFSEGIAKLLQKPEQILLEVGPGRTLTTLVNKQKVAEQIVLSSLRHPQNQQSDIVFLLNTLSQLWLQGIQIDWTQFYDHEQLYRIPLPTYPFEKKRYWIEPLVNSEVNSSPEAEIIVPQPTFINNTLSILKEIFSNSLGIKSSEINIHTPFLEMGIDSLLLLQINRAIQEQLGVQIPFHIFLEDSLTIDSLAAYITKEKPQEPIPTVTPLSIQNQFTPALDRQEEQPQNSNVEQILLQHLQVMSKLVDLLPQKDLLTQNLSSTVLRSQQAAQISTQQNSNLTSNSTKLEPDNQHKNHEKLHPKGGGVFGHWELGMGHGKEHTNALCPMPQEAGQLSLSTHKGMEFPAAFNKLTPISATQKESVALLTPHQQKHLDSLITLFVSKTQASKRLSQDYRSYHANSRAVTGFFPDIKEMIYPIHGQRGEGARIWDVDGNEYVDISMGFGTLLFGHSPSFVIEALQQQIQHGILHGPQSRLAGEVAKLICELTGAERAALCNTGSEAVMGAIRLARTATGRSKIALFAGSYHGNLDEVLIKGVMTADGNLSSVPKNLGIPQYMAENAIILNYGTPESLDIIQAHAHELAAILVEPIQSSRPDLQPQEFLSQLRQLTQETGIVLIFDEVITGFRMHPGGIQGLWGIQADITTYGKAVAAGIPIGVIAGKAAFMDALDGGMWNYGDESYPQGKTTFFAGTFFKHPLAMAAAWAALNHIKTYGSKLQAELTEKTAKLAKTLNNFFEEQQIPIRVVHFGSLFRFTFQNNSVLGNLFYYYLLEKGVYVWEGRTLYLSTAHTEADIEYIIQAVKESVVEMQAGEFLPPTPIANFSPINCSQKELEAPLVTIQPHGSKKPLFFIHPIGGNVFCYKELARCLDSEQPFYGLQAPSLFGECEPYTRIEDMAAHYIAAMQTVQPQGPYYLGGWSLGSFVAFEMAQQLQQQGQQVPVLILLDNVAPNSHKQPINTQQNDESRILASFAYDIASSSDKTISVSYEYFQQMQYEKQLNYVFEQLQIANLIPANFSFDNFCLFLKVYQSHLQASWNYVAQVYPNQMILLRASDSNEGFDYSHDPSWGWSKLSSKPVEIYTVPGTHYTMLAKPHVQVLAEHLNTYLNQIEHGLIVK